MAAWNASHTDRDMFRVEIGVETATTVVHFSKASKRFPAYAIDNKTSYHISVYQKGGGPNAREDIPPRTRYAHHWL